MTDQQTIDNIRKVLIASGILPREDFNEDLTLTERDARAAIAKAEGQS